MQCNGSFLTLPKTGSFPCLPQEVWGKATTHLTKKMFKDWYGIDLHGSMRQLEVWKIKQFL